MSDYIGSIVGTFFFILYFFGMYVIISDDHRYTTKDVVIGAVFFPYPWWVAGEASYRVISTTSEDRDIEERCLDASEALGMPRKSRLRYCECFIETKDPEACKVRIFTQK